MTECTKASCEADGVEFFLPEFDTGLAKEPLGLHGPVKGFVEGYGVTCQATHPHQLTPIYAIAFSADDARRISACVNACAGLTTESLECGGSLGGQIVDALNRANQAEEQRDELLVALHIAKNGLVQWHVPENRYAALDVINTAIASVKGET